MAGTSDGTAVAGDDYDGILAPITLVLNATTTTATIDVTTIDDTVKREGNENFFLQLVGLNSPQGEGTIADNDGKGGGNGGGGNGGGGNGGGPKKNAASTTTTDLTDAAFGSLGGGRRRTASDFFLAV